MIIDSEGEGKWVAFTGAAGRVGRRVVPLLANSWKVKGLDLKAGHIEGVPVDAVDLLNQNALIESMRGAYSIIHCAIASYPISVEKLSEDSPERQEYRRKMLDVNIKGAYHVFEAARILKIPQVIYISSLTVVTGYLPQEKSLDEKLYPNPANVYACTKFFGEQLASLYSRSHGIRTICLRLGQPYPLGLPQEKDWEHDAYSKALFVSFADITRAVDGALKATHVRHGAYNIVSRNADGVIAHSAAKEIGFKPMDFC